MLSLPEVGEKEPYQLSSPWCSAINDVDYGCNTWSAISSMGNWTFANATLMTFDQTHLVPPSFSWGFAGLVGLLLLVTICKHIQYWSNPQRGIGYEEKLAGYIAYFLILAVTGFSILIFIMSYFVSKQDYITASVTVCPGISNSTTSNITYAMTAEFCQCISDMLPGTLSSVKEALDMDSTNLARLVYNV